MQLRRGLPSLAAALAAVVLPILVLGVLRTSTSDGRVVTPVTGTASTRPPTSPTGRGAQAGRTRAEPPGKGVRPRGPGHRRLRHRAHSRHLTAIESEKRLIATSARSAADLGVTIADFSFTPASITVHVGDTVRWVNNGPSDHTATANNGSFNTGVLKKGQSASVTFHLPGTFAYHCAIHPFMHGTVVVLASAKSPSSGNSGSSGSSGSSGGSGASGSSTSSGASSGAAGSTAGGGTGTNGGSGSGGAGAPGATTGASGHGTLPFTGVDVLDLVALGLLLSGSGLLLNRLRRRRTT